LASARGTKPLQKTQPARRIGLAKKVLLADNLALYASPVFDAAASRQNGGVRARVVWRAGLHLAAVFRLLGLFRHGDRRGFAVRRALAAEFASPYQAASTIEFWRRWHMTLSRFLRDYLYFPLGGNRKGARRRYVKLVATMVLGGIWHGAGWNCVLWRARSR
jgi:alginate O-acetyltransferase complex protein AlgI